MKIGITQRQLTVNDIVYDCLEQGWFYMLGDHELIVLPNLIHVDVDIDFLILSGGNDSEARYQTELNCCAWALERNIPILGVCHGAFFLNELNNGTNLNIEGHHNTNHEIVMEGQTHKVNSYHNICIEELGNDLEPIAWCGDNIEAFKHKTKLIWGLVWHPERMDIPVLPKALEDLIYG
jgi:gamma-glutamyl-gamma-aminobutyrate hydrolase PuuD